MSWRSLLKPADHDRPALAILFMLTGLAFLSFQDAWVKGAASETSFWQLQAIRSLLNIALLVLGAWAWGALAVLRPKRLRYVALRSTFLAFTMVFFFSGAPFLTTAEMGAGLYTFPIFVTLLSGIVLREPVGTWRLAAVAIAAFGAILIVKPFDAAFTPVQALPVVAGFFYACNVLVVRRFCRQESTFAMAFIVAFAFLIASIIGIIVLTIFPPSPSAITNWPFLFEKWPVVTPYLFLICFIASATNLIGNLALVQAYQSAEPSWLAPIDYSYLALAVLWGYVMFEDIPDSLTILGILLIAGAGLVITWRERRRSAIGQ